VPEHGHTRGRGDDGVQELEALGAELGLENGHSGDISAGPSEVRDVAGLDGVRVADEHDRNRGCRCLQGPGEQRAPRHDHIRLELDQLRRQLRKPRDIALGPPVFGDEIGAVGNPPLGI
jgi:hypothetical protein